MTMDSRVKIVTDFYDMHPISEQQIIDKLRQSGFDLSSVSEDILQNHDQDHFGGVAANDALASLAKIDDTSRVLDLCSGLGGPSRYLAHNYGCRIVGIDLTESRVEGARRLTRMAKLDGLVSFESTNALEMSFKDATFDVLISQEAFCHIPEKTRLIAQCARVLKPGGRLAFTDILVV
jgi:sarcosine/dimethylglycine N-methyltransferase